MKIIDPSEPGTEREIQQRQDKERIAQDPAVSTGLAKRALSVCAGLSLLMFVCIVSLLLLGGVGAPFGKAATKLVITVMFLLPSGAMSAAGMLALLHSLRAGKRVLSLLAVVAVAGGLSVFVLSLLFVLWL